MCILYFLKVVVSIDVLHKSFCFSVSASDWHYTTFSAS